MRYAADLTGLPVEFLLFGSVLVGIALFHRYALPIAWCGLCAIALVKILFTGFAAGPGFAGLAALVRAEAVTLTNLLGLLLGFPLLARQLEQSGLPSLLPRHLPRGWSGPFGLLLIVFLLSGLLDNIAAVLIGGTIARSVFRGRVHVAYLAGLVAAANAGGAGSVVGDTTTTMLWIAGVRPLTLAPAYVASGVALLVCGIPAALQQHRHSPLSRDGGVPVPVDWLQVAMVASALGLTIATSVVVSTRYPDAAHTFPVIAAALWATLGLCAAVRRPDWAVLGAALEGALFLVALVLCASMLPVDALPPPSWQSTLGLGAVSALFDNIPLTALALNQGGYDWSLLAYAVGFGGSMLWFGSSAGVALADLFPEVRSVSLWLRAGWTVPIAYLLGFAALLWLTGWHPDGG
jgi:Na+/H+ antiporter NhaD/arsenite permease-like protein